MHSNVITMSDFSSEFTAIVHISSRIKCTVTADMNGERARRREQMSQCSLNLNLSRSKAQLNLWQLKKVLPLFLPFHPHPAESWSCAQCHAIWCKAIYSNFHNGPRHCRVYVLTRRGRSCNRNSLPNKDVFITAQMRAGHRAGDRNVLACRTETSTSKKGHPNGSTPHR